MTLVLAFGFAVRWGAYPFLAVSQPINGDVLIVEAWLPPEMLKEVADEFVHGKYRRLLVILSVHDAELVPANGSSEWVSAELMQYGVPRESLDTMFCLAVQRDRTYHAALAAKDWFTKNGRSQKSFNLVTAGPHARRSWLLYRKVFGNTGEIGIVALEDRTYDPKHWWGSSEGVREVLGEAIAYVYAKFFFGWMQEPLFKGSAS